MLRVALFTRSRILSVSFPKRLQAFRYRIAIFSRCRLLPGKGVIAMEKIIEMIQAGRVLLIGESRGAKPDVVRYVSKRTGQKEAFTKVVHVVEPLGGGVPVLVEQRAADTEVDPSTVKITVKKGQRYAFEIATLSIERGMKQARMVPGVEPVPV
ncbi:MAG: hypothetical protein RIR25_1643 [Verrucomicrobiota bacterium]